MAPLLRSGAVPADGLLGLKCCKNNVAQRIPFSPGVLPLGSGTYPGLQPSRSSRI